nr:Phosphatase methylesterase 1 [Ipomoea batatas]
MASWVRTITTPFRKARTLFNPQPRDKKSQQEGWFVLVLGQDENNRIADLHGEVMACGYEDVQVMWSILDKSKPRPCNITSS